MMGHLDDLQPYVLLTTGRTGSDFLQSLMDSHTEVLTFNGILFFHDFWSNSKCNKRYPINLIDLLNEFKLFIEDIQCAFYLEFSESIRQTTMYISMQGDEAEYIVFGQCVIGYEFSFTCDTWFKKYLFPMFSSLAEPRSSRFWGLGTPGWRSLVPA